MAGEVGNPNHDPRTGKFTSAGGQNISNSTAPQRVAGRVKTGVKAAGAVAGALVGTVAHHLISAAIQGAAKPIRDAAEARMGKFVNKHAPKIEKAAAKHTKAVMRGANAAFQAPSGGKISAFKHGISAPSTKVKAAEIPGTFPWKKS